MKKLLFEIGTEELPANYKSYRTPGCPLPM